MHDDRIRADFATLDQLATEQGAHAGGVADIRTALRAHARQALDQLGGGIGTEEHQACLQQVERLIDEYLTTTRDLQRSTRAVGQEFQAAGDRARAILSSGG